MAFYAVLTSNAAREDVVVMKATSDPTVDGNWSSVAFGGSLPIDGMRAVQDGTDIHIVFIDNEARVLYSKFSTSTDTWTIDREIAVGGPATQPDSKQLSVGVRSDGDIIVLYTPAPPDNVIL